MKSIFTTFFAVTLTIVVFAQAPQSFSYQAIVRDDTGTLITEQEVSIRVSILENSELGAVAYSETHSPTTNAYGLMVLQVGQGSVVSGSFLGINWAEKHHYIKIEIDPNGGTSYIEMGTSQLLSVPYALHAETAGNVEDYWDLSGNTLYPENTSWNVGIGTNNPGAKLEVKGSEPATALFEVKDKDGNTVFAVYPEGARVYVEEGSTASHAGFTVHGRDSLTTREWMRITPDSIRFYLKEDDGSKSTNRGGFAVTGRAVNKSTEDEYFNIYPAADAGEINDEARIVWYPLKEAFLAGRILVEDPDSVGTNSWASGYHSKSKGNFSQALGYQAIARGNYSTAIGKNAIANSENSFAFGDGAKALNTDAYAFGAFTEARGIGSFAFGYIGRDSLGPTGNVTTASGDYSFAFGLGSKAMAVGAIAMGAEDSATAPFSMAMGYKTKAKGWYSVAMGNASKASGTASMAFGKECESNAEYAITLGHKSIASASGAVAIGSNAKASNGGSIAMGTAVEASGDNSSVVIGYFSNATGASAVAIGRNNNANAHYSVALGAWSTATGSGAMALGRSVNANGDISVAMGANTTSHSGYEMVVGRYNTSYTPLSTTGWNASDRLFVIGNGTAWNATSNAMVVLKNGNVGIGATTSFPTKLSVQGEMTSPAIPGNTSTGVFRIATGHSQGIDFGKMGSGSYAAWMQVGAGGFSDPLAIQPLGGNVGIGTTSPNDRLEVNGTIRASGSGGSSFILHGTSYGVAGTLSNTDFALRTNNVNRLYINNAGDVGIGTSAPSTLFHLRHANNWQTGLSIANSSSTRWHIYVSEASFFRLYHDNSLVGHFNPTSGAYTAVSDKRLKNSIKESDDVLDNLLNLEVVKYKFNSQKDEKMHYGVIAQDVEKLFPELVTPPVNFEGGEDFYTIDYSAIGVIAVKAIQEQQDYIKRLEERIEQLEEFVRNNK